MKCRAPGHSHMERDKREGMEACPVRRGADPESTACWKPVPVSPRGHPDLQGVSQSGGAGGSRVASPQRLEERLGSMGRELETAGGWGEQTDLAEGSPRGSRKTGSACRVQRGHSRDRVCVCVCAQGCEC